MSLINLSEAKRAMEKAERLLKNLRDLHLVPDQEGRDFERRCESLKPLYEDCAKLLHAVDELEKLSTRSGLRQLERLKQSLAGTTETGAKSASSALQEILKQIEAHLDLVRRHGTQGEYPQVKLAEDFVQEALLVLSTTDSKVAEIGTEVLLTSTNVRSLITSCFFSKL